jgi:putative addiction module CopG family antidote
MNTRNQEFVDAKVASGQYSTFEAVVEEAIRRWRESEAGMTRLRAAVQAGIDELDRGEGAPVNIDDVVARGRKRREQHAETL